MGSAYPKPGAGQLLHRADRWLEAKEYAQAKKEFQSAAAQTAGPEHEQALVRLGAADFLAGKTAPACGYLRGLEVAEAAAGAERLYYLVECARKRDDEDAMMLAVGQLGARHKLSPWRLKALVTAANRFLVANRPQDYVPLLEAVYRDFPTASQAPGSHWKVTFQAYLRDQPDAGRLLREHLRQYPTHATAGAALYFLGRLEERAGDGNGARACFLRLASALENHYYGMLARGRLHTGAAVTGPPVAPAGEVAQFVAGIRFPVAAAVNGAATGTTQTRIERARMLRSAGLSEMADAELRFGMRTGGQTPLLAMEMADAAEAPHQALRIMKGGSPEYLNLAVAAAPRKYWELLYPMPYRADLARVAQDRGLDANLLAGLVRQESEFNPVAVSRAKAYGLMQVRPATGRLYARKAGVPRVTVRVLTQPAANLKLGSEILRSMLDHQGGNVEQTLAAYNAGPLRAAEWSGWGNYREPAEFVESIPFTETREYVQAVLRNAEMYRRLYN